MLLGNVKKGLVFIISAPAGTGKTTLTEMLLKEFSCIVRSVSFTTRKRRGSEIHGSDYYFVTPPEFEKKISDGDFLEFAKIYGDYYGTSKQLLEEQREQGKHVVLVIDTQGAFQLKKRIDAVSIFIMPPSLEALRARLYKRKTETAEVIEKRLQWAAKEIACGREEYDYIIMNKELKTAYEVLRSIFIAEEHRRKNDEEDLWS